ELVARAIHYSGSRKNGPFIAVNCAAIPEQLLENELFGHVKGAFTGADKDRQGLFERASGGTLFLDEIDAMSQKMQVSLLRVLQDGRIQRIGSEHEIEINVRIIASSDRRLIELVKAGHFREDLYYRLNVVEIRVPPLRERMEDLPLLCDQILQSIAKREGKPPKRLTREAFQILADCSWPGNVRQLEHVLLNAFIMSDDQIIRPSDLNFWEGLYDGKTQHDHAAVHAETVEIEQAYDHLLTNHQILNSLNSSEVNSGILKISERQKIVEALQRTGGNRTLAARYLGMSRRTFYRRLKQYGITE
ncbi:MAG: sigma-54 dependent transcriptional regulator, partial [Bdellovibrionaceae bacterium]|nr:sigma-54 dependent transcriptional regulator [Pseudobdellovibrionaceae bacterium]